MDFTRVAIAVLNQIIRPFTAEWYKQSMEGAFDDSRKCAEFHREPGIVQEKHIRYTRMLGEMAGVERDLTRLEN